MLNGAYYITHVCTWCARSSLILHILSHPNPPFVAFLYLFQVSKLKMMWCKITHFVFQKDDCLVHRAAGRYCLQPESQHKPPLLSATSSRQLLSPFYCLYHNFSPADTWITSVHQSSAAPSFISREWQLAAEGREITSSQSPKSRAAAMTM